MAVSSRDARWSAGRSAANVVSTRDTRRSKASCCASAIAIALSVVKSYCGSTPSARLHPSGLGLRRALEVERLGRHDVARRELAGGQLERRLRQDVRPEDGRQDEDQDHRRDAEARRVTARESGDRVDALGQHRDQCVPPSCAARSAFARAAATIPLTTLPSARPRVLGASQPMTLPRSRAEVAPGRGDPLVDERGDLGLGQAPRAGTREGWRSPPPPSWRGPRDRRRGTPRPIRDGS